MQTTISTPPSTLPPLPPLPPPPQTPEVRTTPASRPWLRLLPQDGVLTLLLLVMMVYITTASIQSASPQWAPGLEILTTITAFGLLLGYLAVQQGRISANLVQYIALALGFAFAFLQTADAVVHGNRLLLWSHMQTWFHRAVLLHESSSDNSIFLLLLGMLSFLLAFNSVWIVLRARRPWLAALANGVVLLINLNWTTDDRAVVFVVLYLLATLLLLVRFTLAENMRRWRARGIRFSPDLTWDFMQAGSIFAVAVLLLAYLLPVAQPNASTLQAWNSPDNPWQKVQATWQGLFAGIAGRGSNSGLGLLGGGLQLVGTVNLPNVVILHYKPVTNKDDPTQYLMTDSYDAYNGRDSWSSSVPTQRTSYEANAVQPQSLSGAAAAITSYQITMQQTQGNRVFTPGSEAQSFSIPTQADIGQQTGVPVRWATPQAESPGFTYTASGYVSTASIDQLRQVPYPRDAPSIQGAVDIPGTVNQGIYSDGLLKTYLPDNSNVMIAADVALAARQHTKGAKNMYDAATMLENYLRVDGGFVYSTQNPDPPSDQDAVSWFLQRKQGFCTFFASAMALMGRSLGMPTRLATGFAAGSYDVNSGTYIVKGTQAHVWTQIYFAGYGWVNFEPTSSFSTFDRAAASAVGSTTTPTVGPGGTPGARSTATGRKKTETDTTGTGPARQTSQTLVNVGLSLSALIIAGALAVLLFMAWWRLLYRGLTPVTMAFARVARLGAWAGAPPHLAQTPAEYVEELGSILPAQRGALRHLSDLYARERWGGGLDDEREQEIEPLYEQVRVSATRVIARRARHAPHALLALARRLRQRR